MGEWEYRTIKFYAKRTFGGGKIDEIELENVLNEFGARGWELVTILPATVGNGELWDFVAVLKREIIS